MDIIASVEAGDMRYSVAERQADDTQPFLGIEEATMPEVDSLEIPITVESVLAVLNDAKMDKSVNEKLGIVNYNSTPWELVEKKSGVQRRQISYNLNKKLSQFGSKVSCIQQQTASDDKKKLTIDEILTLHDVPFGDHFQVQVRREHETLSVEPITTHVKVFVGVAWHKSTELDQKKITKNIVDHMTDQAHQILRFTVQEVHHSSGKDDKRTGV